MVGAAGGRREERCRACARGLPGGGVERRCGGGGDGGGGGDNGAARRRRSGADQAGVDGAEGTGRVQRGGAGACEDGSGGGDGRRRAREEERGDGNGQVPDPPYMQHSLVPGCGCAGTKLASGTFIICSEHGPVLKQQRFVPGRNLARY